MNTPSRRTQVQRWVVLPVSLLLVIVGAVLVNNTDDFDTLGIGMMIVAVLASFVTTPPDV